MEKKKVSSALVSGRNGFDIDWSGLSHRDAAAACEHDCDRGQRRNALADVVNGPGGTGGAARSSLVEIAGKTGTAQVVEMKGGYVKTEQLAYFNRDHAWFISYAPVQNPQIAVVVLVEHGGHGGEAAAPMAKKVIEKYIELQKQPGDQRQVRLEGENRAN